MKFAGPPKSVPPERLFRVLLGRPRPVWPLSLRLPFAPSVELAARALTPWEMETARDVSAETREREALTALQRILVHATLADGAPAFRSVRDLGAFSEREVSALAVAVTDGLAIVSPSSARIDRTAWNAYLERGAQHPSNGALVNGVGASAVEVGPRGNLRFLPKWDAYFGLPFADVTDGQRMAYDAAAKVFESWCK